MGEMRAEHCLVVVPERGEHQEMEVKKTQSVPLQERGLDGYCEESSLYSSCEEMGS